MSVRSTNWNCTWRGAEGLVRHLGGQKTSRAASADLSSALPSCLFSWPLLWVLQQGRKEPSHPPSFSAPR